MKIRPLGAELLQADGRTDRQTDRQTGRQTGMTKRIVAFRNFVNTPKRVILFVIFWRKECKVFGRFVIVRNFMVFHRMVVLRLRQEMLLLM